MGRMEGRAKVAGTAALATGQAALVAFAILTGGPEGLRGVWVVGLLAVVAFGAGIMALTKANQPWFRVCVGVTCVAAVVPGGFPRTVWGSLLLVVVPATLLAFLESFLLVRRLASARAPAGVGIGHDALVASLVASARRLPRALALTAVLGSAAVCAHLAARAGPPEVARSLEAASVYGILVAAIVLVLLPLAAWGLLRRMRATPRGPRPAGAIVVALVGLLAVIAAAAMGPARAQATSADIEVVDVDPGEPLVGTTSAVAVTIRNHGPADASVVVDVRLDGAPVGEGAGTSSIVFTNVTAGTATTMTLDWRPSEGQSGAGVVTAVVTRTIPPDPDPSNDAASSAVFVRRTDLTVALMPGEAAKQARPAETIAYRVLLHNAGNAVDSANVTVAATNTSWRFGAASDVTALGAGETREVLVLVRPPGTAGAASPPETADVTVASQECQEARQRVDAACAVANITLPQTSVDPAALDARYEVSWTPPADGFVDAGARRVLPFVLHNQGTAEDLLNITLEVSGASGGAWALSADRPVVALRPAEEATVNVTVQAPDEAVPGDAARFRLLATATHPPRLEAIVRGIESVARISGPDLAIAAPALPAQTYRGYNTTVETIVRNAGNRPSDAQTVNVTFVDADGATKPIGTARVPPLAPGSSVAIRLDWDVEAAIGDRFLLARLELTGHDVEAANDEASSSVVVRNARLRVVAPAGLSAAGGESVPYTTPPNVFIVRNEGNAAEGVDVRVASEHGWLESSTLLDIPAGGERRVPVTLLVPTLPGAPTDTLRLHARLVGLPQYQVSNATATILLDRLAPRIESIEVLARVPLDVAFNVSARVTDDIEVAGVHVEVERPDGLVETHALVARGGGVFDVRLRYQTPGNHTLVVVAQDSAAGTPHVARSASRTFQVLHLDPPRVLLVSPLDGATIAGGTPIQLSIESGVPVGDVRAFVHGRTIALDPPYAVETGEWPAGRHDVVVSARDVFGSVGTASFTFTIDNRAPQITLFEIDRLKGSAQGPAYAFRLTTVGAVKADLVIRRPDSPDEWRAFEGGPDQFTIQTVLPPGKVTVIARAEAATGLFNATDPVDVDTTGGGWRSVPGAGPVWMAAVSLAVALCWAQRRRR